MRLKIMQQRYTNANTVYPMTLPSELFLPNDYDQDQVRDNLIAKYGTLDIAEYTLDGRGVYALTKHNADGSTVHTFAKEQ